MDLIRASVHLLERVHEAIVAGSDGAGEQHGQGERREQSEQLDVERSRSLHA